MNNTVTFVRPQLNLSGKWFIILPLAAFVLIGVFSSFYTISPESVAVMQRFGQFQKIAEASLQFHIPIFSPKGNAAIHVETRKASGV